MGFAEDAPGLEPGDGSLDGPTEPGVCPVDGFLFDGEVASRSTSGRDGGLCSCSLVGLVSQDRDAEPDARGDDLVSAGRGEIVDTAGQRGGNPDQGSVRCRNDLQVHPMTTVFARVVSAAVTDPVVLG